MDVPLDISTDSRRKVGELLSDPETTSLTLILIAIKHLGWEAVGGEEQIDPLVVLHELETHFGVRIPEENVNKIQGWITLLENSSRFYSSPKIFNAVCVSISEGDLDIDDEGEPQQPEWPEVAWAFWMINFFFDTTDDEEAFGPKVRETLANIILKLAHGAESDPIQMISEYIEEQKSALHAELTALGQSEEDILRAFQAAENNSAVPGQPET